MSEENQIVQYQPENKSEPHFLSLRWRFIFPLANVITVVAMIGAYLVASQLSSGVASYEQNLSFHSATSAAEKAVEFYAQQRNEAQRIAFTNGVVDAMQSGDASTLQSILTPIAAAANLDSIIITDATGMEIIGLLSVGLEDDTTFAINTDTSLSNEPVIREVIEQQVNSGTSGILRTPEGLMIFTGMPVQMDNVVVGVVAVGQRLSEFITAIKINPISDILLYSTDGNLLDTTYDDLDALSAVQTLAPTTQRQLFNNDPAQAITAPVSINRTNYHAVYVPLQYGPNTLGAISAILPNSIPFASQIGRQVTALFAAALTGAVVIAGFLAIHRTTNRIEAATRVTQALASGIDQVRTNMQASDEIGELGQAIDQYANYAQAKHDKLSDMLRRQRRETNYLVSVLQSIPDGVLVFDIDGTVLFINQPAAQLIGSQLRVPDAILDSLANTNLDQLAESYAPGIYVLGDPNRINIGERIISAQAASIQSTASIRLGTVIILRDITQTVIESRSRDKLLEKLTSDIQQPMGELAQSGAKADDPLVNSFAREISRHSANLQKMIVEMRELNHYDQKQSQQVQHPISVDALIWAVANDWRQIAEAASLILTVSIEQRNLYILGDESRLRLAIGNIIDNAIKYTRPGGAVSLEVKGETDGLVHLRIRDNGVGIAPDELDSVFIRFYRGTPKAADNTIIHVPGMGQGLTISGQLISAHGGYIKVRSKLQIGTAVYIALPATASVSYTLPYLDDDIMEGDTMHLPEDVDIDAYWKPENDTQ